MVVLNICFVCVKSYWDYFCYIMHYFDSLLMLIDHYLPPGIYVTLCK
jgi:hypothetical protein